MIYVLISIPLAFLLLCFIASRVQLRKRKRMFGNITQKARFCYGMAPDSVDKENFRELTEFLDQNWRGASCENMVEGLERPSVAYFLGEGAIKEKRFEVWVSIMRENLYAYVLLNEPFTFLKIHFREQYETWEDVPVYKFFKNS